MRKMFLIFVLLLSTCASAATTFTAVQNGTWVTAATWDKNSSYPQAGDTAIMANGVTVTLGANAACAVLTCVSGGVLAMVSYTLTTTGNITLAGAGCITATTGILSCTGTQTLTSNGITFPGKLYCIAGTPVLTLVGNWVNTGFVYTLVTTVINLTTAETMTCNGGIAIYGTTSGTATLVIGGTGGAWSSDHILNNNLTINCTTCSLGSDVRYGSGTLTYTAGTVTQNSHSLTLWINPTLATAGLTWYGVTLQITLTTVTLTQALNCTTLYIGNKDNLEGGPTTFTGAFDITCATLDFPVNSATTAITLTLVAGQTLNITSAVVAVSPALAGGTLTIKGAASYAYINYTGTPANCNLAGVIFTDVQATGKPLYNFNGGTLTRSSGIVNFTAANCFNICVP